jgi:hypothetical protein
MTATMAAMKNRISGFRFNGDLELQHAAPKGAF